MPAVSSAQPDEVRKQARGHKQLLFVHIMLAQLVHQLKGCINNAVGGMLEQLNKRYCPSRLPDLLLQHYRGILPSRVGCSLKHLGQLFYHFDNVFSFMLFGTRQLEQFGRKCSCLFLSCYLRFVRYLVCYALTATW